MRHRIRAFPAERAILAIVIGALVAVYLLAGREATAPRKTAPAAAAEEPAAAASQQPARTAQSPPQLMVIPERFRGEWNADLSDCGTALNDSRLRIGSREVSFYESRGRVTEVREKGPERVDVSLALAGEGESWVATYAFRISPDAKILLDVTNPEPVERFRCPQRSAE